MSAITEKSFLKKDSDFLTLNDAGDRIILSIASMENSPSRTHYVGQEDRAYFVGLEDRNYYVGQEDRAYFVGAEDRTYYLGQEDRTYYVG